MGLISAASGAVGGTFADQWKEYFYCDSLNADTLAVKGCKRTDGRSSNTKGTDNIITSGSVIAVADGQCMMIVDQGRIAEVCAEPGEFIYDASTEPSIFSGKLGKSVAATFKEIGKRFTFGGEPAKDQRVYYFNTKEIPGNKYGTPNPVPFRVVDKNIGLDMDIAVKCFGEYSYHMIDPLLFYTNVCGNVTGEYKTSDLDGQLKAELLTALQPAFAKISELEIRYSAIPAHTAELSDSLNEILSAKWKNLRGIEIVSFGISSVTADEEDEAAIKRIQQGAALKDANLAAGVISGAQAQAMTDAANNSAGAVTGFMGMGMAMNAASNAASLYAMGAQQQAAQNAGAGVTPAPGAAGWICTCGAANRGNFCTNCGAKRPADAGWICTCGAANRGNFCTNCGTKRP